MPIGIQRLNAKRSQPNPNIVFIKPLPGPSETISQQFLERIAAQCVPVMRRHHLSVTSLEEYEPNREFVGRNFNAGEVIQLVLRSRTTGHWLPFEYVQMVMMHELAHCKQMNHSRAFWAVRNQYAGQMREIWGTGYTGDGVWGRGANLGTGEWEHRQVCSDEVPAEHLCGGTYRSRRRRRKNREVPTYKERQERRVLKKFGRNGVALGADHAAKVRLEGKVVKARPRVAGSARGRELRAAAALARFGNIKEEGGVKKEEEEEEEEEESESEDGLSLLDGDRRTLVKVCEDEDPNDADVKNELSQLRDMFSSSKSRIKVERDDTVQLPSASYQQVKMEPVEDFVRVKQEPVDNFRHLEGSVNGKAAPQTCSACSFDNAPAAGLCSMCANVLNPLDSPASWRCAHASCSRDYINSNDCGICGLCGQRRVMDASSTT